MAKKKAPPPKKDNPFPPKKAAAKGKGKPPKIGGGMPGLGGFG